MIQRIKDWLLERKIAAQRKLLANPMLRDVESTMLWIGLLELEIKRSRGQLMRMKK